jgi:ankyrin repeat protein
MNCARTDTYGFSALHYAAFVGHKGILSLVIGATPPSLLAAPVAVATDPVPPETTAFDMIRRGIRLGSTPLHCAAVAASGAPHDACDMLIAAGIDPGAADQAGQTAVHLAAFNGNLALLRFLYTRIARPTLSPAAQAALAADPSGLPPAASSVARAAEASQAARDLALAPDSHGATILHLAALSGSSPLITWITAGPLKGNLSQTDAAGRTALHFAVRSGSVPAVQAVAESGQPMSACDDRGNTCLHYAAAAAQPAVVRFLLGSPAGSALVAARNDKGETPIFCAALAGLDHASSAASLAAEDACPSAVPSQRQRLETLLHLARSIAASHGLDDPVLTLRDPLPRVSAGPAEAQAQAQDNRHRSGFSLVRGAHSLPDSGFRLARSSLASLLTDDSGTCCLHAAAAACDVEVLRLFVDGLRLPPDLCDGSHATPLHHAAQRGSLAAVEFLLNPPVPVEFLPDDPDASVVLSRVSPQTPADALSVSGLGVCDDLGLSPLFFAASGMHFSTIAVLVAHDAASQPPHPYSGGFEDPEASDASLWITPPTALTEADTRHETCDALWPSLLLSLASSKLPALPPPRTPLEAACANAGLERHGSAATAVVMQLLHAGADPMHCSEPYGSTPLLFAAASGSIPVIRALFDAARRRHGVEPDELLATAVCRGTGASAVLYAVAFDRPSVLAEFAFSCPSAFRSSVAEGYTDKEGNSALRVACVLGLTACVRELVSQFDFEADPAAAELAFPHDASSPLLAAVALNRVDVLRVLLRAGAPPFALPALGSAGEFRGRTLLHVAAEVGDPDARDVLIPFLPVAAAWQPDAQGVTPLHIAAYLGHAAFLAGLLARLAACPDAPPLYSLRDAHYLTPAHAAAACRARAPAPSVSAPQPGHLSSAAGSDLPPLKAISSVPLSAGASLTGAALNPAEVAGIDASFTVVAPPVTMQPPEGAFASPAQRHRVLREPAVAILRQLVSFCSGSGGDAEVQRLCCSNVPALAPLPPLRDTFRDTFGNTFGDTFGAFAPQAGPGDLPSVDSGPFAASTAAPRPVSA